MTGKIGCHGPAPLPRLECFSPRIAGCHLVFPEQRCCIIPALLGNRSAKPTRTGFSDSVTAQLAWLSESFFGFQRQKEKEQKTLHTRHAWFGKMLSQWTELALAYDSSNTLDDGEAVMRNAGEYDGRQGQ